MYFFYYIFSKILATNIDSITSYSKIREEIKFMYVCMYPLWILHCLLLSWFWSCIINLILSWISNWSYRLPLPCHIERKFPGRPRSIRRKITSSIAMLPAWLFWWCSGIIPDYYAGGCGFKSRSGQFSFKHSFSLKIWLFGVYRDRGSLIFSIINLKVACIPCGPSIVFR